MQYQHIGHRIKGFYTIAKYAARHLAMLSDKAKHKQKILQFWSTHGLQATTEAFGISRRTLFLWKKQRQQGVNALEEKSKRPHHLRQRKWSNVILEEIQRLRTVHPNLGKEKLYCLLKIFCDQHLLTCPKPRTIGRIIADNPHKMRVIPTRLNAKGKQAFRQKQPKLLKPKGFKAQYPGHCVAFDTVERIKDGYRRYIITFTDIYSRFAFAFATSSHASQAARQFFLMVIKIFPFTIEFVLTDQGSEFKKAFAEELKHQHKVHWHTYPKTPKMNAHNERFNRTVQEEFVEYHLDDLIDNTALFNYKLMDYLAWFNAQRPHWALDLQSPLQFLRLNHLQQCNMYWPNTHTFTKQKI